MKEKDFSEDVIYAIIHSKAAAKLYMLDSICTECFLIGVLSSRKNSLASLLSEDFEIDLPDLFSNVKKELENKTNKVENKEDVAIHVHKNLQEALLKASVLAHKEGSNKVELKHMFLAVLKTDNAIKDYFKKLNIDIEELIEKTENL